MKLHGVAQALALVLLVCLWRPPWTSTHFGGRVVGGVRYVAPYYHTCSMPVPPGCVGKPLSQALHGDDGQGMGHLPVERWQAALLGKQVTVRRQGCSQDASETTVLHAQDELSVSFQIHEPGVPSQEPKVLHEDENLLVVNKPGGVYLSRNPRRGQAHLTLESLLRHACQRPTSFLQPAYRIDRPVSGLVIFAKDRGTLRLLGKSIRERRVSKYYLAKVNASMTPAVANIPFSIQAPLSTRLHKPSGTFRASVDEYGKPARTDVTKLLGQDADGSAMLLLRLHTGRTHQIRCHLQHVGLPVLCDHAYGGQRILPTKPGRLEPEEKQQLHAMLEICQLPSCRSCKLLRSRLSKTPQLAGMSCFEEDPIHLHSYHYSFHDLDLSFTADLPTWFPMHLPADQIIG